MTTNRVGNMPESSSSSDKQENTKSNSGGDTLTPLKRPASPSTAVHLSADVTTPRYRESFVLSEAEAFSDNASLIYSRHERMNLKSCISEPKLRETFLKMVDHLHVMLDLNESKADVILDTLLTDLLADTEQSTEAMKKLMNSAFTHDQFRQYNRTIQGMREYLGQTDYDHNWICAISLSPSVTEPRVGIARLRVPANVNRNCQDCQFVIVIVDSLKASGTRFEVDRARLFGTLMSDPTFRNRLQDARTKEAFRQEFARQSSDLASMRVDSRSMVSSVGLKGKIGCRLMRGVRDDLKRRLPHYWSDYVDGVRDRKSLGKTLSCTMFLYFICILPSIAFGVLNEGNTKGILTVERVLASQTFGGVIFALFGGTTQIVLLTTAPLSIYANVVFIISQEYSLNFRAYYACVGLWNSFFLILYSVFDISLLMQYSTRSSEEIFAFFISITFAVDAFMATADEFNIHYNAKECKQGYNRTAAAENVISAYKNKSKTPEGFPKTLGEALADLPQCEREISLLYLLLMLGTVWGGLTLYNFTRTPYLTATKRELIADYSLPIAVIVMCSLEYFVFQDVNISKSFKVSSQSLFSVVDLSSVNYLMMLTSLPLGLCLSLLFFMDQNISAAMVNDPKNKMKKGTSYHWDLMVVALINLAPSLLTYPMVHAALPHSPLHLRALADVEERVVDGHVTETVVRVRETRLAALFSHMLIGASLTVTPYLAYIPRAVLYGLFLYVAITPLYDNQMFERVQLLFTEEAAYPPTYYIRQVPQRKVHLFTLLQLLQLVTLCAVGFSGVNFVKLFFPVLIFCLIPFRHFIMPLIVDQKYIRALDYCY